MQFTTVCLDYKHLRHYMFLWSILLLNYQAILAYEFGAEPLMFHTYSFHLHLYYVFILFKVFKVPHRPLQK